ncbi:MAG TPA: BON domain-containing protein [Verrucomicrobiae bacterium]|nr:BON domain-containing protein [Verrucomicrobiae bacterium]
MQTKLTTWILPLAAGAAMLGMTGCMSTSDRTAGRVMDDRGISSRVKSALKKDPVFKYEDVDVQTYNGVVQLSGWATTADQVERASGVAQRVEGVSGVINHISIKRTQTGRSDGYPYPKPADDPTYYGRTNTLDRTNALDNPSRPVEAPLTPVNPADEPLPPPPNTPNK